MNFELIYNNFFIILSGLDETLKLVIISLSLGFIIAIPFALARASSFKILSQSVYYYVFIIRGTPLACTNIFNLLWTWNNSVC